MSRTISVCLKLAFNLTNLLTALLSHHNQSTVFISCDLGASPYRSDSVSLSDSLPQPDGNNVEADIMKDHLCSFSFLFKLRVKVQDTLQIVVETQWFV